MKQNQNKRIKVEKLTIIVRAEVSIPVEKLTFIIENEVSI